jgi:hypothetical protein
MYLSRIWGVEDPLGVRRGERETLEGFLDWYLAVVERKVDGLTLDDAKRVTTPSGMSALGVLKHLGWVERGWCRQTFAGEDVEASTWTVTTRPSSPSAATTRLSR